MFNHLIMLSDRLDLVYLFAAALLEDGVLRPTQSACDQSVTQSLRGQLSVFSLLRVDIPTCRELYRRLLGLTVSYTPVMKGWC